MLMLTEWVLYLDFNLVMEAESAAETSCFIKTRNDNIPVFVTANNNTFSCIFRLDNFFVKIIFLWYWTGRTLYIVFFFQRTLLHRPSKQKNDFSRLSKIAKATVSFVMFVRLSVRMEQLGSHWTDFNEIWYLRIFRNSIIKIQVLLKSDKNKVYFTWSTIYIFLS